jgi:cold shock CspA family protein
MTMFDKQIDAHSRSLERAPKRQSEKRDMTGKYCGTCHRWSQHGYGFIQPDTPIAEIAGEVFVGFRGLRRSGINHPLQRGDRLSFDISKTSEGRWEACNIALLDQAAAA